MVHRLVEMLEVFVPLDPRKVFLQVSALVEGGRRDNYQYESLAIEHIVRLLRDTLLSTDLCCKKMQSVELLCGKHWTFSWQQGGLRLNSFPTAWMRSFDKSESGV